jgi:two-component system sensor histidine kinase UhpB
MGAFGFDLEVPAHGRTLGDIDIVRGYVLHSLINTGIKFRLNMLITAAFSISLLIGGIFAVHNYRRAVSTETEASAQLVLGLLRATESLSVSSVDAAKLRERLIRLVPALTEVRHVRLEILDAKGNPLTSSPLRFVSPANGVPHWFVRLVAPPSKSYEVPIVLDNVTNGSVVVTTDPDDEVAEQWTNTRDLLLVVALSFFSLWMLIIWYVSYALRPIDNLHSALDAFGRGESVRTRIFGPPEFAGINRKFNEMADALENASNENRGLNQRLIELRDEERRAIARELHDNLAQYLFAIRTDAFAISRVADAGGAVLVGNAAQSISESASKMEEIVRKMILQLRPLVLDELGLEDALRDLVATWSVRHAGIACDLHLGPLLGRTPRESALAVYYVVGESLTNVAKHSGASAATVCVKIVAPTATDSKPDEGFEPQILEVSIEDNGRGVSAGVSGSGVGLVGMHERVETLGGRLDTAYHPGHGWVVTARLPLPKNDRANAA